MSLIFALVLSLLSAPPAQAHNGPRFDESALMAERAADPKLLALEQKLAKKLEEPGFERGTEKYARFEAELRADLDKTFAAADPAPENAAVRDRILFRLDGRSSAAQTGAGPGEELESRISRGSEEARLRSGRALGDPSGLWRDRGDLGVAGGTAAGGTPGPGTSPQDAYLPRAQLPRGFRSFSEPPPPPDDPKAPVLPSVVDEPVAVKPVGVVVAPVGKSAQGEVWTATYSDGTKFEVVAPVGKQKGLKYHTVQQAADAASYLPPSSRAMVKQIILAPARNPDDAYWSTTYKNPKFRSYMTAGASGIIRVYPVPKSDSLPDANYMRGTMIHETGHTFSRKNWGPEQWKLWREAMAADKRSISKYAKSSEGEDFAETYQAYWSVKGTPKFDTLKKSFPNRFALLETEAK